MTNATDIAALKARIASTRDALAKRFWEGDDIDDLVAAHAQTMDRFLRDAFTDHFGTPDNIALIAVGGYGRSELHPESDIDLLLLIAKRRQADASIEAFVRLLWDIGLEVGHSVRTPRECRREAARDLTIATGLFERRLLAGSRHLEARLDRSLSGSRLWPSHKFFDAKRDEQRARHKQFDNVDYGLEPNIKSSPGGLRDIQTISWIIAREFGTTDLNELTRQGVLSAAESATLEGGRRFLWRVRYGLHVIAGRKEDRLLFDHQRELAERFGYADRHDRLAVEQFMQAYYRHVMALGEVNDLVLQHFEETILRGSRRTTVEALNERFSLVNNHIEIAADDVFAQHPPALLEMFVIAANRRDIAGVTARTIRSIRAHLHLIDEAFRNDPEVTSHFIALLRAPYTLVTQLTRMRRYGILGRYIPEFGNVIGQMQHDLFHIYTVDAHTMLVIRNMRRFRYRSAEERFPVASHCVKNLPKVELLYIAGLYHDIAKGRGGDHSELGAEDVRAFCERHNVDASSTDLVEFLVRAHLVMSTTAQQKDIHDPEVVLEFARLVRTEVRLDYLYALTVADINATNPTLWNGWRATLMHHLYSETRKALRRGLSDPVQRSDQIRECLELTREKLAERGTEGEAAQKLLQLPGDDFYLTHTPTQAATILATVASHDLGDGPLVLTLDRVALVRVESPTEVFIYSRNEPQLFSRTVRALVALELSIHEATIETHASGVCFDAFMVLDADNRSLANDDARLAKIRESVARSLDSPTIPPRPQRMVDRQLRQFAIPTQVTIATPNGARHSVLRVTAADRPGLLGRLGALFAELEIVVHNARISTLGERVEDTFAVTELNAAPITDARRVKTVEAVIAAELDAEIDGATAPVGIVGV